jgi:hypothetical protein
MGTRNLTAVYMDGEYRVAQYGQWDGYPAGQGETIRAFFAREDFDMERFKERISQCSFFTKDEIDAVNKEIQAKGNFNAAGYGYLSRDTGAEILSHIYDSEGSVKLTDQLAFVGDSLFCEWAYVIDLDKGVLEVYDGFHTDPTSPEDRFHEFTTVEDYRDHQYAPVKINTIIPLSELAGYDMGSIKAHDEEEEEEEAEV